MEISKEALGKALGSISQKARKVRLGDEIPEDEVPSGFMISIGIEPMSKEETEELEEGMEEALEEEEE
tara:strand:- start:1083 stop:1286 length:204 start_codon:yes stop_codon:yes gene_type:complete